MKIAVLGTGVAGRTLAGSFTGRGHDVAIGTRDVDATLAISETDRIGNAPFSQWQGDNSDVRLMTFADAGAHGELVVNATAGGASLAALEAARADNLTGKVLVDVANALDFSQGMPPTLSVANTDSLAEQIQRAFPEAKVVKTLNTMNASVMVNPAGVPGDHDVFVAGEDADAKETVKGLLRELGWKDGNIVDLGGIRSARGMEMYLPLWLSLMAVYGQPSYNIKVVRA
jgi:predicted dinucleotide-binding enzyme